MVRKENSAYLFIGQDSPSKDIKLASLKKEFLDHSTQHFDLDVLYAKELNLRDLQERLLSLPLGAKERVVVIRDAQRLKEEVKGFIAKYVKKPKGHIVLVLDMNKYSPRDEFIRQISGFSEVCRFKEDPHVDTFVLSRAIESRKPNYALTVLNQLLRDGEKPERILGGLRYSWENSNFPVLQVRKRLALLLACDLDIKTGRTRPDFALEKLVVNLCCFTKPSG